ncbi:hypothetical protein [Nocardia jiangxiensis]|uniref:hypothetical protein n=1 Tax=Nocardia jiangxiensis TaxID=282685 RepID=UPI0002E0F618|nr:hypothetical protein [Nocardia jiangxiensis]
MPDIKWHATVSQSDYTASVEYLALLMSSLEAAATVDRLRQAKTVTFYAKDIIRAARLPVLPLDDPYVSHELDKINKGLPLSPILLIRGKARKGTRLIIADGYHRVCANYRLDPDNRIPCHITDSKKMK